ncbi:MAG: ATP-binding protein [Saprospiraceae bacterium]|nr:ATP-binding protein [Saprospiraceae bacterium]
MQKNITRSIKTQMEGWLYRGKVLILYGARQVGKTTLSKSFLEPLGDQGLYLNCEIQSVQSALSIREPAVLRRFIGNKKLVVFDEAQYVPGIGEILKLLIDTFPDMQIIATGSSSFQLADRSSEALTGRALTFELYPFSYTELSQAFAPHELKAQLDFWLRFGFYPDIAFSSETDARTLLDNLSSRYLYQDVLEFENLKRAEVLVQLLQLLALQIGQLVSYHELANTLKISSQTVERYINLLEKAFVIFRLLPFSRNLRSEIGKKNKIFFYDIGIRNSIIQQYQPMELRSDKGALWENFLVVERLKRLQQLTLRSNRYFWRTYQDAEIDYIEERDGRLSAYEFKWQNKPARLPVAFANAYPGCDFTVVHRDNFEDFIGE